MCETPDPPVTAPGLSRAEAQRVAERCAQLRRGAFGATRVTVFRAVRARAPWPADLLEQVAEPREGERPAGVDRLLQARPEAYRRFRQFFRHAYGHKLDRRKKMKTSGVAETLAQLRAPAGALRH